MKRFLALLESTVGLKIVMGLTGIVLFLFVLVHMIGNLQIFMGRTQINEYGNMLKSQPEFLWGARGFLLLCVALHIWSAITLTFRNNAARPRQYAEVRYVKASLASRSMIWTGLIALGFLVVHLLHFTVGLVLPQYFDFEDMAHHHDVYRMMISAFQIPWVVIFYIVGVACICWHLSHGVNAMFRSLGWTNMAYGPLQAKFARYISLLIFLGFASIPLAVLFGYGAP
jgi:succinate dehydrogenase / fumarate reductase cytochrome b subunit